MNKRKYKIFFSLFLTIIFIGFLLFQIDAKDFISAFKKIDLRFLFAAFAFFVLANFFQARRFRPLLKNRFNLFQLFNIVCVHNFFFNTLPLRSGELSYLYLINKSGKVKAGENFSSLIMARLFDFFIILILFFISSAPVLKIKNQLFWQAFLYLALLSFFLLAIFLLILFRHNKLNSWAEIILRKTSLDRFKIFIFLQAKIKEILEAIQGLKSPKIFLSLFFNSLLIWFSLYFTSFLLARGVGLNLSFFQIIFVFSLPLLFTIFFIQGVGGFGTVEGGLALGLVILGIPKELAISSSFVIHSITIFYLLILAVPGFINLKKDFLGSKFSML